jgi:GT2 family glycosyltransferase
MAMNDLISICIPTCDRPELLKEAVLSCYAQTYRPLEIIVGDDSRDNRVDAVLGGIATDPTIEVRYHKNQPPLGQAGNVNDVFERARGERIVLLHDDDALLPDAIENLANCWTSYPELTAAFGKQYIISATGELSQTESDYLNSVYFRTKDRAGLQDCAVESALLQQFPNDAFMIRSDIAKRVSLRERSEVGDATDFDFGIRVALEGGRFYFVNKYIGKYRYTPGSIRTTAVNAEYMFPIVQDLQIPREAEHARRVALKRMAPVYVKKLALGRKKMRALKILFGQYFDRRLLYSSTGLVLLGQILVPGLDPALQKIRKMFSGR